MMTPCRVGLARREDPDARPARRVHTCSEHHAALVDGYRAARAVWEDAAEWETIGYATELREYRETHPAPTFRDWLQRNNGRTMARQDDAAPAGRPVTDDELARLGY